MKEFKVNKIIFSSSASIYGNGKAPFTENSPIFPDFLSLNNKINTYAKTKFMIEQILFDIPELSVVVLRYFNPVGSHASKLLCESPNGIPNNLMPRILQFAANEINELTIFGNDYPTLDGTCIRDYIHVTDLALGHVSALKFISSKINQKEVFNLGTGKGTSTLELIKIFEKTNDIKLNYKFGQRRSGDAAICYASTEKSLKLLNWQAKFDVPKMCFDAWQAKNLFSSNS
jgi:UDP-glucose 4-epimerase